MEFYTLDIQGKKFKVAVADNDQLRSKGLSGLKRLSKGKGMLFIFPEAVRMSMVMRDMNFDLDFIFIDKNWKVVGLDSLSKDDTRGAVPNMPCHMVLEINKGAIAGINIGDNVTPEEDLNTQAKGVAKFKHGGKFELVGEKVYEVKEDDIKADPNKLQILNDKGEVVANIESGSRIFSRPHTKEMIAKFKKGDKIGLAKSMINILDIQNTQEQDYVTK